MHRRSIALLFLTLWGCGSSDTTAQADGSVDASVPGDLAVPVDLTGHAPPDLTGLDMTRTTPFCDLAGSLKWSANGATLVGALPKGAPDLSYLHLPPGFCSHWFARVGDARQVRFAPSGELFVASPTKGTTGGNSASGQAAIVVVPDDDNDGVGDAQTAYLSGISATQGMAFIGNYFYYQDNTKIFRVPYKPGDRTPSAKAELVADIQIYVSGLHWPKPIDVADDGTIYVGNGGDQGEACDPNVAEPERPFHGGILKLDGSPGGAPVARGFRNPIVVRCARGHNRCFALELSLDYSQAQGGREKLIPIKSGDDWGYPCCATQNLPYMGINPIPDCAGVQPESGSFVIGDTPFGLDFEGGAWPAPWTGRAIVSLHGAFGTLAGARVVAIAMDGATGLPLPNVDKNGVPTGAMSDFATGWDDHTNLHGRPADLTYNADGRLFLANDVSGDVVWIAPYQ